MEVTVRRTGGFAGVHEQMGPVDTNRLDDGLADRLQAKLAKIAFFELPNKLPEESQIDDGFFYEMTITDRDRSHTVAYGDGTERRYREPLAEVVRLLEEGGATYETQARE
jgi:hypothetical protein